MDDGKTTGESAAAAFAGTEREFARRMAIAAAGLTLLVVPAYQLESLIAHAGADPLFWQLLPWRLLAVGAAIATLTWCTLHPDGRDAIGFLRFLAVTIMVMICGMLSTEIILGGDNLERMSRGLVMSTFAVSVLSLRGARELLVIFSVPLALALVAVFVAGADFGSLTGNLFDAAMMLVVGLIVAEVLFQNRLATQALQNRLQQYAATDVLTGLDNRRFAMPRIRSELHRARRHPTTCCILMADLDHFKRVNDEHGHAVGDIVLRELARRIRSIIRAEDRAVRWGGEEFLILLPETDEKQGLVVAEKLRRAVADEPVCVDPLQLHVTVSVGLEEWAGEIEPERLIDRADAALYQAKRSGRNRVCAAPRPVQPVAAGSTEH